MEGLCLKGKSAKVEKHVEKKSLSAPTQKLQWSQRNTAVPNCIMFNLTESEVQILTGHVAHN